MTKSWDKRAKKAFLNFAKNPDCERCPLGFDARDKEEDSKDDPEYFRQYQQDLEAKASVDFCVCCPHILNTRYSTNGGPSCPCHLYGNDEAFKILQLWAEKEGL